MTSSYILKEIKEESIEESFFTLKNETNIFVVNRANEAQIKCMKQILTRSHYLKEIKEKVSRNHYLPFKTKQIFGLLSAERVQNKIKRKGIRKESLSSSQADLQKKK